MLISQHIFYLVVHCYEVCNISVLLYMLPTVLLRVIRKVRIVVIATTQRRTVLEKAPMIRMMTDMTISTWTAITIMTDMTATVIMRMGWMMRWTRLGRIGKDALYVKVR